MLCSPPCGIVVWSFETTTPGRLSVCCTQHGKVFLPRLFSVEFETFVALGGQHLSGGKAVQQRTYVCCICVLACSTLLVDNQSCSDVKIVQQLLSDSPRHRTVIAALCGLYDVVKMI